MPESLLQPIGCFMTPAFFCLKNQVVEVGLDGVGSSIVNVLYTYKNSVYAVLMNISI